jgi:hypothetical protein
MWDLVTVKNLHELLVEFPVNVSQPTSGAVVNNTPLFLQVPGLNPCHGKLFLQHFMTYAYTWDPGILFLQQFVTYAYMWDYGIIYDDLEHTI